MDEGSDPQPKLENGVTEPQEEGLEFEDEAIIVVGRKTEYKECVSKALALQRKAENVACDLPGGRRYYQLSSGKAVVLDTSPLEMKREDDVEQVADKWSSTNLRGKALPVVGKDVSVVCAIDYTSVPPDYFQVDVNLPRWLDLLAKIFMKFEAMVATFLVKISGRKKDSRAVRERVITALATKGFSNSYLEFQTSAPSDEDSLKIPMARFFLGGETVKVMLMGRTCTGKSTLAQMLTKGKLDSVEIFGSSRGVKGKSSEVEHDQGNRWYVVDTPSLQEPLENLTLVPTQDAVKKIYSDIDLPLGIFTHFIYVCGIDLMDMLETCIWNSLGTIFGELIETNFTVVISGANQDWVDQNTATLSETFTDCKSFLGAEFPENEPNDEELEEENLAVRKDSLRKLEDALVTLKRVPVMVTYGQDWKMTVGYQSTKVT